MRGRKIIALIVGVLSLALLYLSHVLVKVKAACMSGDVGLESDRFQSQRRAKLPTFEGCKTKFVRYVAHDFELTWSQHISELKSDEPDWLAGCEKLRKDTEKVNAVLAGLEQHRSRPEKDLSDFPLSYFEYEDTCTGQHTNVYIEPLISFLRHPYAICFEGSDSIVLDKSYLMLPFAEEVIDANGRNWLFDAGASTYDTGAGGASQSWFVNTYRERGIEFDRIIGWEAAPTDPKEQWGSVPADIKRKSSWFNIPATTGQHDADNPLTFIKELAKVEDFVVFKLDVDAPFVEIALVQQILQDPELLNLIDEFYFEHHVTGSPMQWRGWGNQSSVGASFNGIQDSYDIFTTLRERGVRAHSWV